MKASSNKMYDKYKEFDFSDAKPVVETPHLAKLQAEVRETCLTTRPTGRAKK